MGPPKSVIFRGSVPAAKEVDLDGNGKKDVLPTFYQLPDINDPKASSYTFKDPGGLRVGKDGFIPFDPVPSRVSRERLFTVYQVACTNKLARFHNPYDSRSFAVDLLVAELNLQNGTVGPPKVIAGFTVDLKPSNPEFYRHHHLEPVMNHAGYVLSHAFAMENKTRVSIAAVPDLVWIIGKDERICPEWILNPPKRIVPSLAEQLLKPLYEAVDRLPKHNTNGRQDIKARIEAAMSAWQTRAVRQDPQRARDLTQEPLRTAIVLSLFQLTGLSSADFED